MIVSGNFPCPACGAPTSVRDSRPSPRLGVRRRRWCANDGCGAKFTTMEVIWDGEEHARATGKEQVEWAFKQLAEMLRRYIPAIELGEEL
jgi:transcriptional regulator NrdR family protein